MEVRENIESSSDQCLQPVLEDPARQARAGLRDQAHRCLCSSHRTCCCFSFGHAVAPLAPTL